MSCQTKEATWRDAPSQRERQPGAARAGRRADRRRRERKPDLEGADALAKGQIIGRTWATAASVLPTYALGAGSSAGLALENDVVLQAKHPGMPAVR